MVAKMLRKRGFTEWQNIEIMRISGLLIMSGVCDGACVCVCGVCVCVCVCVVCVCACFCKYKNELMLLFLAMIGHDRLTPQRQNHAIYQYALMTFLTNEKPITFSGFFGKKSACAKKIIRIS